MPSFTEPMTALNKIDAEFNTYFDSVVKQSEGLFLYSSKNQEFDIRDIAKDVKLKFHDKRSENQSPKSPQDLINSEINKLLNTDLGLMKTLEGIQIPQDRRKRYEVYKELPEINYIAYRTLKVFVDNILVRNAQTKEFLNIKENPTSKKIFDAYPKETKNLAKLLIKSISVYFDLSSKIKNDILPDTLRYGNFFVEVIDSSNVQEILSADGGDIILEGTLIPEMIRENRDREILIQESEIPILPEERDELYAKKKLFGLIKSKLKNQLNESTMDEHDLDELLSELNSTNKGETFSLSDLSKLDFDVLSDLNLSYISPDRVLILKRNGVIYGYIVVEEDDDQQGNFVDVFSRLKSAGSEGKSYKHTPLGDAKEINRDKEDEVINAIMKPIFRKISEHISDYKKYHHGENEPLTDLDPEVRNALNLIILDKIKQKKGVKIRLVPSSNIVDFYTVRDKFSPYGTSVFDSMVQPIKLYTIAMLSSVIARLSRASTVRKWNIEVGALKNHSEVVQKFTQSLKNKSISFDDITSVKNIGNVITDFRDIVAVQRNGQRFVDMELMPMHDRGTPLNDMNDLRNEVIASSGIPSVYLNIGDQVDLRETLVNLNISFAGTINTYQSNIEESLNKLLNIIFMKILEKNSYDVYFKLSNYLGFSLNTPLVLTIQANEALISSVSNIMQQLKGLGLSINPEEMLKMYIPNIDWEQITKAGDDYNLKISTDQAIQGAFQQPDQGGF